MLSTRTYLRASMGIGALALASLPGCPSEQTPAQPPTVDRIVIGGGAPSRPAPAPQVEGDPALRGLVVAGAEPPPPDPPPPPPAEVAAAPGEPPAPPLDPGARDDRKATLHPRSKQLLVTELQGLEALFASIEKDNADRPRVERRLADDYDELAAWAEREASSGAPSPPSAIEGLRKVKVLARDRAIRYYTMLWREHPSFCERPNASNPAASSGCADEVLYYMGYAQERAGKLDVARQSYFQLVKNYPSSRFVPLAYFAFGESFYDAARSDPSKWAIAAQAYSKVLDFKDSPIAIHGASRLRLVCQKINEHGESKPGICEKIKNPSAVKAAGGDHGE